MKWIPRDEAGYETVFEYSRCDGEVIAAVKRSRADNRRFLVDISEYFGAAPRRFIYGLGTGHKRLEVRRGAFEDLFRVSLLLSSADLAELDRGLSSWLKRRRSPNSSGPPRKYPVLNRPAAVFFTRFRHRGSGKVLDARDYGKRAFTLYF